MSAGGGSELLHEEVSPSGLEETFTGGAPIAARSPLALFFRRIRHDYVAIAGLVFIALMILMAIFAKQIIEIVGTSPPNTENPSALSVDGLPSGPSSAHPFGVDQLGRDVFSRVVYGSRISLIVAFLPTAISVIIGLAFGMIAGYFRGLTDTLLARSMDIMLAFPVLLFALGLASACTLGKGCLGGLIQPGLTVIVFVIAFAGIPYVARIMRGQVLSLREKEFVEAAKSLGSSNARIIAREVLPNLVAPIIVYTSLIIPTNILFEAALSFLGVGIQPPTASWGQMIAAATPIFQIAWWFMIAPGVALVLTVLAFNLVGDGLQDALNPRRNK